LESRFTVKRQKLKIDANRFILQIALSTKDDLKNRPTWRVIRKTIFQIVLSAGRFAKNGLQSRFTVKRPCLKQTQTV